MAVENLVSVTNGKGKYVAEYLSQLSPIIEHTPAVKCNNGDMHKSDEETSLAKAHRIRLNEGTPVSTNTTREIVSSTAMYSSAYQVADKVLKRQGGGTEEGQAAYLARKHKANLRSITSKYENDILYGNNLHDPLQFTGLHNIYDFIETGVPGSPGCQVIDAGGTGDGLTSIDLCLWSESGVHLIYPDNETSQAITTSYDKGNQSYMDDDGNTRLLAGQSWIWDCQLGIHVEDVRAFVRIANIKKSVLENYAASDYSGPNLVDLIRKAQLRMSIDMQRGLIGTVEQIKIYAPQDIYDIFDSMLTNGFGNIRIPAGLSRKEIAGKEVTEWRGSGIFVNDAIADDEERVELVA